MSPCDESEGAVQHTETIGDVEDCEGRLSLSLKNCSDYKRDGAKKSRSAEPVIQVCFGRERMLTILSTSAQRREMNE